MKKLIGIVAILLITTGVFGQIFLCNKSIIETIDISKELMENISEDNFRYVSFIKNDFNRNFVYLLGYEPNFPNGCYDGTERSVYLYCLTNWYGTMDWIRVSDAVMTNYLHDSRNYRDVDFLKYDSEHHNTSNSEVAFDRNDLIFTLNIHTMENGRMNITTEKFVLKFDALTAHGYFYKTEK